MVDLKTYKYVFMEMKKNNYEIINSSKYFPLETQTNQRSIKQIQQKSNEHLEFNLSDFQNTINKILKKTLVPSNKKKYKFDISYDINGKIKNFIMYNELGQPDNDQYKTELLELQAKKESESTTQLIIVCSIIGVIILGGAGIALYENSKNKLDK